MDKQEIHIVGTIQTNNNSIQQTNIIKQNVNVSTNDKPLITSRGSMTSRQANENEQKKDEIKTEILENPITMYVTAKNGINVRDSFSIESNIVKTLPYTTQVIITEKYQNWVKTGENQWIVDTYLSKTKPVVEKIVDSKKETQSTTKQSTNSNSTETGYTAFTATGYCKCSKCCGKSTGRTASGATAQAGVTVAMPSRYSFGTKIEIKGMGTYIVQDRGGAIQGNKIDIFFNSHQEALNFGRRTVYLKIL